MLWLSPIISLSYPTGFDSPNTFLGFNFRINFLCLWSFPLTVVSVEEGGRRSEKSDASVKNWLFHQKNLKEGGGIWADFLSDVSKWMTLLCENFFHTYLFLEKKEFGKNWKISCNKNLEPPKKYFLKMAYNHRAHTISNNTSGALLVPLHMPDNHRTFC